MNYGLIFKKVSELEKYVFGAMMLPRIVLQENGQWTDFLPEYEPQFNRNFDTSACTIFGTINAEEILEKRLFSLSMNYSERFHYNLIPIRPPGGDPHDVAESIRKHGMISQELLPMTETFDTYIAPEPVPQNLVDLGLIWAQTHEFGHEWLWRGEQSLERKIALIKEALPYSPIGVSVSAWHLNGEGKYEDRGYPNNHWCVCVGYEEIDGKTYFKVFDSYDHEIKVLSAEHNIQLAKRYTLSTKVYNKRKLCFIEAIIKKLQWI